MGSSPRARGAAISASHSARCGGIIPARAGSRPCERIKIEQVGDHPRARGEQASCGPTIRWPRGSSPRARGAGGLGRNQALPQGIIPARAGSRWSGSESSFTAGDHPRARGEQDPVLVALTRWTGSSPRARGAEDSDGWYDYQGRIIPARAGSRAAAATGATAPRDHPRARGEQRWQALSRPPCEGSSPRARGAAATSFET